MYFQPGSAKDFRHEGRKLSGYAGGCQLSAGLLQVHFPEDWKEPDTNLLRQQGVWQADQAAEKMECFPVWQVHSSTLLHCSQPDFHTKHIKIGDFARMVLVRYSLSFGRFSSSASLEIWFRWWRISCRACRISSMEAFKFSYRCCCMDRSWFSCRSLAFRFRMVAMIRNAALNQSNKIRRVRLRTKYPFKIRPT